MKKQYLILPFFYFDIEWYDEEDKNIYKFIEFVKEKSDIRNRLMYNLLKTLKPHLKKNYGLDYQTSEKLFAMICNYRLNYFDEFIEISKIKRAEMVIFIKRACIIREGEKVKNMSEEILRIVDEITKGKGVKR